MDPNEIAHLCESLSIQRKEEKLWGVKDQLKVEAGKKLELCLVGKLLSTKYVNRDAFRAVMPKIWRAQGLEIEVVQDNTVLFYFHNQEDRCRVLAGGPWSFDNSLLVMEKLNGLGEIGKVRFQRVEFWVQIHNAPLLCMTKELGEYLGKIIGDLVDIDVGSTGECFGKYLRVRVAIDISQPLKRFLRMDLAGDDSESLLLLRYEKLPNYCFCYGLVGHSYPMCKVRMIGGARAAGTNFDYGPWIRAINPLGNSKQFLGRRAVHEDSSTSRGSSYMNTGSHNKNKFGDLRRESETKEGQFLWDQGSSGKTDRNDTDMILEDEEVGKNQGNQVQQVLDSLLTGRGYLADGVADLGGNIEDEGQGNKGNVAESSSTGCGGSSKDVFEGLEKNSVSGGSTSTSIRNDRFEGNQITNVGPEKGLYKVAVALNSPKNLSEEAKVGSESFSG
ncbi:hypothetical protein EZV62_010508 [Acer yangbiense]|uniref:DUF4283 domain-containing protein n=1 Tax=Acer yangbiense TaxID=1000413 RepID=A0A5C7I347_9ROSI|nr:hypothetical protein EZV62_010508 [Acer yangbiense]